VAAPLTPSSDRAGIRITGLCKAYGETVALDGLDFEVRPGEVVGVAGPNGAGKSTLIKILAGEVAADSGAVYIDGDPWSAEIGALKVAVVHQEPELFGNLTVAENLMVGREGSRLVMHRAGRTEFDLLDDLHIGHHAKDELGRMALAVQQKTEIARALIHDARVVLFDEPNSALTEEESDELFRRIHMLADEGRVVLLVSHRLAELAQHADRVVVIVDGKTSAKLEGAEMTKERIAQELVVGASNSLRTVKGESSTGESTDRELVLHLRNWSVKGSLISGVEVVLPAGQVTAFIGVEGSGARALVQSLGGVASGGGEILKGKGKGDASGGTSVAFVAANRSDSLFPHMSVGENMVIRLGAEISGPFGYLNRAKACRLAEAARSDLLIKAADVRQPISDLSGGNQQKVAIGSALMTRPKILVLEEPTRGVDVASKAEIYTQLGEFASEGNAVAIFCTEDVEVFEVADIVHVVAKGMVSEPISVSDFNDVRELAAALSGREHFGDRPESNKENQR